MSDFNNKVAIVTGGGRDIGRAISRKLAERGAAVVVNYRKSEEEANETVQLIENDGGRAIAVQADVTKQDDVERLVQSTRDAFGDSIHILVNNAGGLIARKTMDEMDEAFWHKVMDVNLTSIFLVTKAVLPHMPEGSAIVNLASLAGRNGGGGGAIAYATAKGAVLTFTRGLAKEVGSRGIRANCVSPGLIGTTFHDMFTPDEARKQTAAKCAAGREGTSEDVADAVAYLASDEAAYIIGESLEINGGLYFS